MTAHAGPAARIAQYAPHVGKDVCVHLRGGDVYDPGEQTVQGTWSVIAERVRGGAGWRGKQYDAVIVRRTSARAWTFALTRIVRVHPLTEPCAPLPAPGGP